MEVDGPTVVIRLSGRFWHATDTVMMRVTSYVKNRYYPRHCCYTHTHTHTHTHATHATHSHCPRCFYAMCPPLHTPHTAPHTHIHTHTHTGSPHTQNPRRDRRGRR